LRTHCGSEINAGHRFRAFIQLLRLVIVGSWEKKALELSHVVTYDSMTCRSLWQRSRADEITHGRAITEQIALFEIVISFFTPPRKELQAYDNYGK